LVSVQFDFYAQSQRYLTCALRFCFLFVSLVLSRLRRLNTCGFRFRFLNNNKKYRKISKPREIRLKSAAIAKILSLEKILTKESIKRGHKNPNPNPKYYINKRKQQQRIFTQ